MYPVRTLTWQISCTKRMKKYFNTIRKNNYWWILNTNAMGLENEDFSNEDQYQCMYI